MNPFFRTLLPLALVAALGVLSPGCAGMEDAAGATGIDAGASPPMSAGCGRMPAGQTCMDESQCEPNLICAIVREGEPKKACRRVTGTCSPGVDAARSCFAGARCEATAGGGGRCTFAPETPRFFAAERDLTVSGPDDRFTTRLRVGQSRAGGFSFRWERPRLRADAITVVAAFSKPPRRSATGNRIANPEDIVWAWTSDLAGAADAQTADISEGRAGFLPDGTPSPMRLAGLPPGRYFWLVFALEGGVVTASSRPRTFSVLPVEGGLVAQGQCDTESDCVATLGGVGEAWSCVSHVCVARCSSELDCAAMGQRCELDVAYCGFVQARNSGHCGSASALPTQDAGTRDTDAGAASPGTPDA